MHDDVLMRLAQLARSHNADLSALRRGMIVAAREPTGRAAIKCRREAADGLYDRFLAMPVVNERLGQIMGVTVEDMPPPAAMVLDLLETVCVRGRHGRSEAWAAIGVPRAGPALDRLSWPVWRTLRDLALFSA